MSTLVTQIVWPRALKNSSTAPCGLPGGPGTISTSVTTSPARRLSLGRSRRSFTCSYSLRAMISLPILRVGELRVYIIGGHGGAHGGGGVGYGSLGAGF